jgi:hypothetical protein
VELDIEYGDFLLEKIKLEIWRIENPKTLICAILNFLFTPSGKNHANLIK